VLLESASPLAAGAHDVQVRIEAAPAAGPRAARLTMAVDGTPVASAEVATLYRARGDAYIGRKGGGTLLPGQPIGVLTGVAVQSVDIDTKSVP